MRHLLIVLLFSFLTSCAQKFNPEITEIEIKENIRYLASDSLKGRRAGESGDLLAAQFIRDKFEAAGLELYYESGFQKFNLVTATELGSGNSLVLNNKSFEVETDFLPFSFSSNSKSETSVVFAGYGLEVNLDTLKWNDYENIDVSGKWVLALLGDPDLENATSPFVQFSTVRSKALLASDKNAAGLILVGGPSFIEKDELTSFPFDKNSSRYSIPIIQLTRKVADEILTGSNETIESLEKKMLDDKTTINVVTQTILSASVDVKLKEAETQNVVALVPGIDENLKNEFVVVGGHYDHLGMGGPGSGSRVVDTIAVHNGADDNASGISTIIELAEKVAGEKSNKRSIIFAAFGAEEMGLVGSKAFTSEPPVKIENMVGMFNFDMVGRLDSTSKRLSIGGSKTSIETEEILNEINSGFDLALSPEGTGPSDHSSFYLHDIPVFFISTGAHSDYHTPIDDFEFINFKGVKEVTDYAYELLNEIANRPEKLTFQESGAKFQRKGGGRFKVTFGIMPDFAGLEKRGMRIDGVTKGKPAQKGGILKGDIITAINGKKVGNIYDYMGRLKTLEAGQTVSVDLIRGDEEIVLIIQL